MTYNADCPAVMAVISACSDSPFIDKTIDRRRRTPAGSQPETRSA
jgi:hypothetical protein